MSNDTPVDREQAEAVYRRRLQIENATSVQLAIERACRELLESHHRLCDNPKPGAGPLPAGTLTPALAEASLTRKLAEISGVSPPPVSVYCDLSDRVGEIRYRFMDRATGRWLTRSEQIAELLFPVFYQ
jgi:hypothetical protein